MAIRLDVCTWERFKAICIVNKGLNLQYTMDNGHYRIYGPDTPFVWAISIPEEGADAADFVANYKALCNFRVGTALAPFSTDDFVAADGIALPVDVTGDSANLDVPIVASNLFTDGGRLVVVNAKIGDWIEIQVVNADTEGINPDLVGVPLGYVLRSWGKDLVDPAHPNAIRKPYAGHPPLGSALRVVYHKATRGEGEANPTAGVKINLHAEEI